MIFKCKICGGELNVERGQSIVECEYCGVKQTLPKFFDENVKLMYDRANNYLLHSEFDKAENIFNQILFADKEDADAYWSLVLCKYGISYVKDPKTGKYVPTCNRTYYSSVFDDENYKNAIKYANKEKAELFKADAKTIDNIQHGIIAISKKEKPFDIFISYKETASNGGRTKDSIAAQDLYEKLTNEGYKVFFSRITLEDKIGTEYEPYIYAALASSRIMITVCSSKENIESVWVKNEWSRFFSFSQKDSTKTILPLYFDMDKSDLPGEFAHLPSYDMKTDGFEQDLIRGIKKLIPLPIMEKERREKRKKIFKKIGIGAAACLVIAAICMIPWFMKLPDYNAAMQLYYDKNYPEAAWTFADLGKYRKSQEMKDKCEKSWRKSLATVATDAVYYEVGASYCITPNGTVESVSDIMVTDNRIGLAGIDLTINEHGRPISIAGLCNSPLGASLYCLYEDGYVARAKEGNGIDDDSEWHNIIQISAQFNTTNVALRNDGRMIYGTTERDKWLEEISQWKDITSFGYSMCDTRNGKICSAIVGVRSDGKLNGVFCDVKGNKISYNEAIDRFYDVKKVYINNEYPQNNFWIGAITNHNSVMIWNDGTFNEYTDTDMLYINKEFEIGANMDLTLVGDDKAILKDVTFCNGSYCVTRSGGLYKLYGVQQLSVEKSNLKACVYDEWLED